MSQKHIVEFYKAMIGSCGQVRRAIAFKILILTVVSCGTKVGNPIKPSESGDAPKAPVMVDLPLMVIDVPASVLGQKLELNFAGEFVAKRTDLDPDNILVRRAGNSRVTQIHVWLQQGYEIANDVNKFLGLIAEAKLNKVGIFKDLGAEKNTYGSISEIVNDESFNYRGVFCQNDQKFLIVKWSSDGRRVVAQRDLNRVGLYGLGLPPSSYVAHVEMNNLSEKSNISINSVGVWPGATLPRGSSKGTIDGLEYNVINDSEYSIRGDLDLDLESALGGATINADLYLSGIIKKTGELGFVSYIKIPRVCSSEFDETAQNLWEDSTAMGYKGWCIGYDSISADLVLPGSVLNSKIKDYKSVGFYPQSRLKMVKMSDEVTCPK